MHSFLYTFFDLIYPYTARIKIPALKGDEGIYEKGEARLKPGDTVIDAGANAGLFSFFAAGKVGPQGRVYAFESLPEFQQIIEDSIPYNLNGSRVTVIPQALGSGNGEANINFGPESKPGDFAQTLAFSRIAPIMTLDQFAEDNGLNRVDFIKADIEGYERHFLKGAEQVLKSFKPRLAICTYHYPEDRQLLTDIIMSARPDYKFIYTSTKLYAW